MIESKRPDPDELLRMIKEEDEKDHRKGRLKIFLDTWLVLVKLIGC